MSPHLLRVLTLDDPRDPRAQIVRTRYPRNAFGPANPV
jgi:hypothetical protein